MVIPFPLFCCKCHSKLYKTEISVKILPLDENLEFMPERVVAAKRDASLADLKHKIFSEFFSEHAPSPQDVQILRVSIRKEGRGKVRRIDTII
jgi:hypothetical protein